MEKKFVTYDIAVQLEKLGYSEPCIAFFDPDKHELHPVMQEPAKGYFNVGSFTETLRAPLWQDVVDWMLDEHDINIEFIFDDCQWEARLGKLTIPDFVPDETIYLDKTSETIKEAKKDFRKIRKQAILKAIEICQKENQ